MFIKVIEITFKGRLVQLVEARELERNVIKITVITFFFGGGGRFGHSEKMREYKIPRLLFAKIRTLH